MDIFVTNVPYVLLTVICIIVFSFIGASDTMDDTWSRQLKEELVAVGHMIEVEPVSDSQDHSSVPYGRRCRDAVTQLTDAVTQYIDCVSLNALNSSVCKSCVDYYLNAASLVAENFSVRIEGEALFRRLAMPPKQSFTLIQLNKCLNCAI